MGKVGGITEKIQNDSVLRLRTSCTHPASTTPEAFFVCWWHMIDNLGSDKDKLIGQTEAGACYFSNEIAAARQRKRHLRVPQSSYLLNIHKNMEDFTRFTQNDICSKLQTASLTTPLTLCSSTRQFSAHDLLTRPCTRTQAHSHTHTKYFSKLRPPVVWREEKRDAQQAEKDEEEGERVMCRYYSFSLCESDSLFVSVSWPLCTQSSN